MAVDRIDKSKVSQKKEHVGSVSEDTAVPFTLASSAVFHGHTHDYTPPRRTEGGRLMVEGRFQTSSFSPDEDHMAMYRRIGGLESSNLFCTDFMLNLEPGKVCVAKECGIAAGHVINTALGVWLNARLYARGKRQVAIIIHFLTCIIIRETEKQIDRFYLHFYRSCEYKGQ